MLRNLKEFSLPELEEKVLGLWKSNDTFQKSLARRKGKKQFVFYEGPPTANGKPGIHHILARSFKDIIPRYKTMRGFFVPRKGGWDTHGLPVELEVERQLGIKSKKEIEHYGVAAFNKKCRESVWKYKDEWERLTERIGFWLDLKNPYVTYETSYVESLWAILSHVWHKKMLYKGHRVVPWCTRCGTGLSSHELALGYKEVEDTSVYVKFKLKPPKGGKQVIRIGNYEYKDIFILSWTTTPWTLPGNVALAVGKDIKYVVAKGKNQENFVIAEDSPIREEFGRGDESPIKGSELVGLEYEPLFEIPGLKNEKAYKIYDADFVTTTDGTGVVHTAVMYGEDDYKLGKKVGLPQHHTVLEDGMFEKNVPEVGGMYVKAKSTEEAIIGYLEKRRLLLKTEKYTHEYPHCWRCGTALLYYARDSWFIEMSKLKAKLQSENQKIQWVPEHLKKGRFGEWLKDVKDWAISRERYWGTPLPIWECGKCGKYECIGGDEKMSAREELSSRITGMEKTGRVINARPFNANTYILMRHGESMANAKDVIDNNPKNLNKFGMTLKGKTEVESAAKKLLKEVKNIDLIISSDFLRTLETAEIISKEFGGIKIEKDERIRELNAGIFDGRPAIEYHNYFSSPIEKFTKTPPEGESLRDVAKRTFEAVNDLEKKYKGKTILLISHESTVWGLETAMRGWSEEEASLEENYSNNEFIKNAEFRTVPFLHLPRNEYHFADLHRPYIDEVVFPCDACGGVMHRVKEVVDVWFDSGSMPFAQSHWPFEKRKKLLFPADYISEGVDQTRGWFYTLLAVSTLLGKGVPYKNVISLGLILDKNGQKMSKSKGNVVDPWGMVQKYGADAVRWYFYTVNPPGEPKRFDEADLQKAMRQFLMLVYNSFVFLEVYGDISKVSGKEPKSSHVLDKWILSRLHETITIATASLDHYEIGEAARSIEVLGGDLSRWYIRRSRRRLQKPENSKEGKKDYEAASETLGYVLLMFSKLVAPFMPFFGDALFRSFQTKEESVHLSDWPKGDKKRINRSLLTAMEEVRRVASIGLAKRAEAGIKVRQPLQSMTLKNSTLKSKKELLEILKDEVNVKEILFNPKQKDDAMLDTTISVALKHEGIMRDFVRMVQDMRQDAKLTPKEMVVMYVVAKPEIERLLAANEALLKREVKAKQVEYKKHDHFLVELESKLEGEPIWVALKKIE